MVERSTWFATRSTRGELWRSQRVLCECSSSDERRHLEPLARQTRRARCTGLLEQGRAASSSRSSAAPNSMPSTRPGDPCVPRRDLRRENLAALRIRRAGPDDVPERRETWVAAAPLWHMEAGSRRRLPPRSSGRSAASTSLNVEAEAPSPSPLPPTRRPLPRDLSASQREATPPSWRRFLNMTRGHANSSSPVESLRRTRRLMDATPTWTCAHEDRRDDRGTGDAISPTSTHSTVPHERGHRPRIMLALSYTANDTDDPVIEHSAGFALDQGRAQNDNA